MFCPAHHPAPNFITFQKGGNQFGPTYPKLCVLLAGFQATKEIQRGGAKRWQNKSTTFEASHFFEIIFRDIAGTELGRQRKAQRGALERIRATKMNKFVETEVTRFEAIKTTDLGQPNSPYLEQTSFGCTVVIVLKTTPQGNKNGTSKPNNF